MAGWLVGYYSLVMHSGIDCDHWHHSTTDAVVIALSLASLWRGQASFNIYYLYLNVKDHHLAFIQGINLAELLTILDIPSLQPTQELPRQTLSSNGNVLINCFVTFQVNWYVIARERLQM